MKQETLAPGLTYHIFNRGNNKENIFLEDKNYYYFLDLLTKHILPIANDYAYCLLKNHFHLLLKIKEVEELPEKMKDKPYLAFSNFFNAYTKSVNKMYSRSGSLFQEHLKRKRVDNAEYLVQLIGYIHLNPIKHRFPFDYKTNKYSSFLAYSSTKATFLKKDFIFSIIDQDVFENWHDERKLNNDNLLIFLEGME